MGKFDVSAAAGKPAEEKEAAKPARRPAAKKSNTNVSKPASKAARKPAAKKASIVAEMLADDAADEGTVQIAVRIPPSLKQRLRTDMARAGLVQEKFVAALIRQGLDELEELLEAQGR